MDPPENLPPPPPLLPGMSTPSLAGAHPPGGEQQGAAVGSSNPAAAPAPAGNNAAGCSSSAPSPSPGKPMPSSKNLMKAPPAFKQMIRDGKYGTKGAPVVVECNHFRVKFRPRADVFHYNVVIEPVTKKVVSRKIMNKLYDTFGQQFLNGKRFAYDGEKSLFTVGPLAFNSHEFPVHLDDDPSRGPRRGYPRVEGNNSPGDEDEDGRPARRQRVGGRDFSVVIAYAAKVDMGAIQAVLDGRRVDTAQDGLRVLDIMLREHAVKRDFLLIRDSYFHKSLGPVMEIGEGVQAWRGYHVSFRPTSGGCLTLNFDLSLTTVIKPACVIHFIEEHLKKDARSFREADWAKARRVLKGILVETYGGRKQKILGFSPKPCNVLSFEKKIKDANGNVVRTEEVTVANYFQTERNIKLQHPLLPALDLGRPNKPQYVPMELCRIGEGQRYKRNLSGVQRKNHIDSARQGPSERKQICQQAMDTNDYNADELVKEFNVEIERKMMTVKARVLEPPSLLFGNREEKPTNGRWNFNSKRMKNPLPINNWAVANFGRTPVTTLANQLRQVCGQKGMVLDQAVIVDEPPSMRTRGPEERVNDMVKRQLMALKPVFVLAILPEKSSELYAPFKKICETTYGVVTQCIVPPRNVKDQYLTNVALKINLKKRIATTSSRLLEPGTRLSSNRRSHRGGYNTVLAFEEKKLLPKVSQIATCIFGLDVSHGSPGDASSPSIAAAVASMNWPNFSTYTTRVRSQAPKTEMIKGLYEEVDGKPAGMVIDLLKDFYGTCKAPSNALRKPSQIVIYRDGVSESQFDQVLEEELMAFKKAVRGIDNNSDYNPKMTLVVVQKRHHTRFFPATGKENVKPGTIVDRDVCHPRDNDFFLCSHAGLIGTSRPTHYHVLYDEIGFTTDELQHLTHCLCYSYARCTTAVSVVAPAYYAHLAAQHCRNYVSNDGSGSESSMGTGRTAVLPLPALNSKLSRTMFYT